MSETGHTSDQTDSTPCCRTLLSPLQVWSMAFFTEDRPCLYDFVNLEIISAPSSPGSLRIFLSCAFPSFRYRSRFPLLRVSFFFLFSLQRERKRAPREDVRRRRIQRRFISTARQPSSSYLHLVTSSNDAEDIKIEKRKEIFRFRERGHGFVHVTSMEHASGSDSSPAP